MDNTHRISDWLWNVYSPSEQAREFPERRPLPAAQTHPAPPGTAPQLGPVIGVSGLERRQVVIAPGVCTTFPKLAQPFCRHDLI